MEYILHADDDATDRSDLEKLMGAVAPAAKVTGCANGPLPIRSMKLIYACVQAPWNSSPSRQRMRNGRR